MNPRLAKLPKLGHEGRSGARAEVDDQRPASSAGAEKRDDLLSCQVEDQGVGGYLVLMGLL